MPPRSRPLTDGFDRDAARARLAADRAGTEGLRRSSASWPSGMRRPSWPSMSSVRIASRLSRRSSRRRTTRSKRRWPCHICEPSSPTRPIRTARMTSPGVRPTRAAASRFTATCSWGRPVSCSARRSAMPSTPRISPSACPARRDSSSRSGPKMRTDRSAGVPPRPSSIRMPSGVVNSTPTPGRPSSRCAHVVFDRFLRALPHGLQHHQHVRHGVRHRVLGALGAARAPHDVLDLRHLAQDVLHAVVQAVHLLERGLGRQHRLQQERPLVELRHEVAADPQRQRHRRARSPAA